MNFLPTTESLIKWTVLLTLIAAPSISLALDLSISGQNETRYARGSQPGQSTLKDYGYFENYLELNASMDRLRFHVRQSYKMPSEFGQRLSGLDAFDKRFIEFKHKYLTIRGGNFYRSWGQGLFFGATELVELNFDSGLDGVLIESSYGSLDAALYRGVEADISDDFREAAEGTWLSYRLPQDIRIGGSFSHLDEGPRHPVIDRSGIEAEADLDIGSLYAVYTADRLDSEPEKNHHAFYGTASVYGFGWALFAEYRNYNLFTYNDPSAANTYSQQPSLQYPPTGMPEATMYLLDRHPRLNHWENEVGYQLEMTLSRNEWNLSVNFCQLSERENDGLIPVFKEQYSPYQAMFIHLKRDPFTGERFALQGGFQEDVEFTSTALGGYSNWFKRIGLGGLYEREVGSRISLTCELQLAHVDDVTRDEVSWDEYFALTFTRSPELTITGIIERSDSESEIGGLKWQKELPGGRARYWPSGEISLNLFERHQIRLFVGHERGGLRCTGGVCRWVNPFKGVKINFISQF